MKKILSISLCFILLLSFAYISVPASATGLYDRYIVFKDGAFQNGGYIVPGSGVIIEDNCLVGGEGLYEGEIGEGSFAIALCRDYKKTLYSDYRFMFITCCAYKYDEQETGMITIGDDSYTLIESGAAEIRPVPTSNRLYLIDLTKINDYQGNKLILSNVKGYKVKEIVLSNIDFHETTGLNIDPAISSVSMSNTSPQDGDTVYLNATVRDMGGMGYNGFLTIDFYKNGTLVATVDKQKMTIGAYGYAIVTADVPVELSFGSQTIYACISYESKFQDWDPTNNKMKKRFIVQ